LTIYSLSVIFNLFQSPVIDYRNIMGTIYFDEWKEQGDDTVIFYLNGVETDRKVGPFAQRVLVQIVARLGVGQKVAYMGNYYERM
jgi:hypothetical protein